MILPPLIAPLSRDQIEARWAARKMRGVFRVSDADYHGGPGLSSTGAKRLLISPGHFKTPIEETDALKLGRAIHCALLEPERFASSYRVFEGKVRNGKAWETFEAAAIEDGATVLTVKESEQIAAVARALAASRSWRGLVDGAELELAAYAQNGSVLTKAKADIITADGIIADVKSCQSAAPHDFIRDVGDYGYFVSAAWYLDVFSRALKHDFKTFVWIAVEKKPPYAVRFYVATAAMIELGKTACAKALEIYNASLQSGQWPAGPDEFSELPELPFYITRRYE